jgi:hypothetical protein
MKDGVKGGEKKKLIKREPGKKNTELPPKKSLRGKKEAQNLKKQLLTK